MQKQAQWQSGTSGPTPEGSVDDSGTSRDESNSGGGVGGGYNRREAVMRASLVRCASVLVKGNFRRATLEVSNPAAMKDARDAALPNPAPSQRSSEIGPDPFAAILSARRARSGKDSAEATKKAMDAWESSPAQMQEEPSPWMHGEQMVTAATSVQKLLQ
ncbi:unnamed protein product [Pylaiella littoralis]